MTSPPVPQGTRTSTTDSEAVDSDALERDSLDSASRNGVAP